MPSKQQKRKGNRREANRRYYQKNKLSLNTKSQIYRTEYNTTHRQELKAKSQRYNRAHRQELKVQSQEYNRAHRQELKVQSQEYNRAHRQELKIQSQEYNRAHRQELKVRSQEYNRAHRQELKVQSQQYNKAHTQELKAKANKYNRAHKKKLCAYYKQYYKMNSTHIKTAQRHYYSVHKDKKIAAVRKYQLRNARKILKWARKYYAEHRASIGAEHRACIGADRRRRYELTEPKPLTKQNYITEITKKLTNNSPFSRQMLQSFKDQHEKIALKMTAATSRRAASSIAATRLVNKVLQIRRHLAGSLLKMVRAINKISISTEDDLGEGSHCVHGEPYYYDTSYIHGDIPSVICVEVNIQSSKQLLHSFKDQHEKTALKMTAATSTSSIPATRLVNKVLQIRRDLAGTLLKVVRTNNKKQSDLGEDSHCEPYHYYESSRVHNRQMMSMESIDCWMVTKTLWSMWFHDHGNAMTCVSLYHSLIYHALLNSNIHSMSPCRKYVKLWMCVMNVRIASMLRYSLSLQMSLIVT